MKKIKTHGIRHPHISLLIDMGMSVVAIADRVGHESINMTFQYALRLTGRTSCSPIRLVEPRVVQ